MNAVKRAVLCGVWFAASAAPQRPVAPLKVGPTSLQFNFIGDQRGPVRVFAERQSAPSGEIELRELRYSIRNSRIASVAASGVITAVSPGTTELVVNTAGNSAIISISVRQERRGDFNGDDRVDVEDVRIIQAALKTPLAVPNDARDLNGDGKLDALDLRILTTLCTHSRCSARQ